MERWRDGWKDRKRKWKEGMVKRKRKMNPAKIRIDANWTKMNGKTTQFSRQKQYPVTTNVVLPLFTLFITFTLFTFSPPLSDRYECNIYYLMLITGTPIKYFRYNSYKSWLY